MKNVVQGNHIEFDLTSKNQAVCSHCQSGFLILVCGVENGLIQTRGSIEVSAGGQGFKAGPFLNKDVVKKWRIACNPLQNSINPQVAGNGERVMCIPSDDIRAVTCPKCLATQEATKHPLMVRETMEAMQKIA